MVMPVRFLPAAGSVSKPWVKLQNWLEKSNDSVRLIIKWERWVRKRSVASFMLMWGEGGTPDQNIPKIFLQQLKEEKKSVTKWIKNLQKLLTFRFCWQLQGGRPHPPYTQEFQSLWFQVFVSVQTTWTWIAARLLPWHSRTKNQVRNAHTVTNTNTHIRVSTCCHPEVIHIEQHGERFCWFFLVWFWIRMQTLPHQFKSERKIETALNVIHLFSLPRMMLCI